MTLTARRVQLTLPAVEQFVAQIEKRPELGVARRHDRHSARLVGVKGNQREQILTLPRHRGGTLVLGAAPVDPPSRIERVGERRLERR